MEESEFKERTMRKFDLNQTSDDEAWKTTVWGENLEIVTRVASAEGFIKIQENPQLDPLLILEGVIARDGTWFTWDDVEMGKWQDQDGNSLWPTDEPGNWSPEETMRVREEHGQLRLPFGKYPRKQSRTYRKEDFEFDPSFFTRDAE